MPIAALHPCPEPGCAALVARGRCPKHHHDGHTRATTRVVRRWYFSARWARLRRLVLAESAHTCAQCHHVELALDVDHIRPHHGDARWFWSRSNLQALCKRCHALKSNKEHTDGQSSHAADAADPDAHAWPGFA